jgi:hypothetical protein
MSPTATEPEAIDASHEFPPEEEDQRPSLFQGWDGLSVLALGVGLPSLLITVCGVVCFERILRMVFKHPVETLAEIGFVALIPIANYIAWKAIRYSDGRHPFRIGLLNGSAIATSFLSASLIFASLAFDYPVGYALLGFVAFAAGCISLYIGLRLRNSAGTRQGRANRVLFSTLGVVLSVAGLAACEAKGTAIRIAETMALSDVPSERNEGLRLLRQFDCEQDLRMQCADERTAGIPGVFWKINGLRERELYFSVTGKPYGNSLTESVYSMSDEYLRRHVVGSQVKGLTLRRSQIAGFVNPETLTSTLNWTFVFKNTSFQQQEARAEIAVPPGAVISGLTLWKEGLAHQANIGPTDRLQEHHVSYSKAHWVDFGAVDPALVTDLGRGRVLLKCSPIPAQGEMKVQVTFTERLKPVELTQASLTLPKFVDTNFALEGDHSLRLHSPEALSVPEEMKLKKQDAADGGKLIVGNLKQDDLNGSNLNVIVSRQPSVGPFYIEDSNAPTHGFIKETIKQVGTSAPEHLVVVVDNSEAMRAHVPKLLEALKKMPSNVKTSVVIPTDGQQMEPVELDKGIELIKNANFVGGKDNLQAVIKAAEAAGEARRGAVLWVHGPQPSFNQEMYIMAPYIQRPGFYELALDDRWTDPSEFFKNHREIGPFVPVPRAGGVMDDLQTFLSKWKTGGTEFVVELTRTTDKPNCKLVSAQAGDELIRLWTRDETYRLLRAEMVATAADWATAARIVTPVTGAAVLQRSLKVTPHNEATQVAWLQGAANGSVAPDQYQQHMQEESAERLQSATNGTIGPQGTDATVIYGVNTAGTVRVNNLANLEALLNIMGNLGALLGIVLGGTLLVSAFLQMKMEFPVRMSNNARIVVGTCILAGAFTLPGCINWLIASARDANLFS